MKKRDFSLGIVTGLIISALIAIFYSNLELNKNQQPQTSADVNEEELREAFVEEINRLEEQLEDDPDNAHLLTTLGNYYFDLGDPDKAIEKYERALAIEPNDVAVLTDCGVMYRNIGEHKKALEYFDKALANNPDFQQAMINKIIVYRYDLNDIESAKEVLDELESSNPDNPHIAVFRAELGL
ncbi:MAG: tetratricopeptide repeat protein [candidate division Zixibacteria bacterium]|nr:tetratricopeptide repeat protein [candidate division Zixibacteria bacterium]